MLEGRMLQRNTGAAGRAAVAARRNLIEQPGCQLWIGKTIENSADFYENGERNIDVVAVELEAEHPSTFACVTRDIPTGPLKRQGSTTRDLSADRCDALAESSEVYAETSTSSSAVTQRRG